MLAIKLLHNYSQLSDDKGLHLSSYTVTVIKRITLITIRGEII